MDHHYEGRRSGSTPNCTIRGPFGRRSSDSPSLAFVTDKETRPDAGGQQPECKAEQQYLRWLSNWFHIRFSLGDSERLGSVEEGKERERMRHSAYIASHCRGGPSYYWRPMEVTPVTAPERARLMPISTK